MKFLEAYSHHYGVEIIQENELFEWVTDIFEAPNIHIGKGSSKLIKDSVKTELSKEGWGFDVKIDAETRLDVFAKKGQIAFCCQTGNISRYAYDVLKMQHLYSKKQIDVGVLAVPSKLASNMLGSNIANFDRIFNELAIFDRTITVPIMLVAFE